MIYGQRFRFRLLGNVRGGDCLLGSKTSCNPFFIFLVFIEVTDVDLKSQSGVTRPST